MKLSNIKLISLKDIAVNAELPAVTNSEVDAALETETLPMPIQVTFTGFNVEELRYEYRLNSGSERMMALALAVAERNPQVGETAPCVVVEEQHQQVGFEPLHEDAEIEELEAYV